MKRSLLVLLVISMLASFVGCQRVYDGTGRFETTPGNDTEPEVPVTGPTDNPRSEITVSTVTAHSYEKILASGAPITKSVTDYKIYMSRGETEGCQIVLYSEKEISGLSLKLVSDPASGLSHNIYILDTNYEINGNLYPDPAKPYEEGSSFTLKEKSTLPFLIEFTSTDDTKSGTYYYFFELRDSSDKTIVQYSITVKVWAIMLPDNLTFDSAVAVSKSDILRYYSGVGDEADAETYIKYYDLLLQHKISAFDLPYDILDPRADAYMSDPRVTSFRVPHDVSDQTLKAYYDKLRSKKEWLKKAYFMPSFEPDSPEDIAQFREETARLQSICPSIKVTAPIAVDIQLSELWDQINEMKGYSTLWCPKLCLWDDEMSYGNHDYIHSMTFEARMRKMMSEGFGVWTYLSATPDSPYTSLYVDHSALNQRILFWQQFQRGIGGFLYGSSTDWQADNWENILGNNRGDGILFYPGNTLTDAPTASLRMKLIRDGIEDYEFLMLAARMLGNRWVTEKVNSMTSSLTSVEATEDVFAQIRIEIGNALEKK